jgi:3',5'-cyclic AMP phosphodiesterase CpdA
MIDRPVRILQVSDTHLSRTHAYFNENWPLFVAHAEALAPDLLVNTGDVTFNGPDNPDDIAFAAELHAALRMPWRAIAGNHDVGETPMAARNGQVVDPARLAIWRAHFGPSWWQHDLEGLRVIGLDSALMGSGLDDEARQLDFLDAALAGRGERKVLAFVHFPPFTDDPDDPVVSTHCLPPDPRHQLLSRCRDAGVLAIGCGHLHRYAASTHAGMQIVQAPSTAMVVIPDRPGPDWRRPRAGFVVWEFDGARLTHRLVEPPLFVTRDMSAWMETHRTSIRLPAKPHNGWR